MMTQTRTSTMGDTPRAIGSRAIMAKNLPMREPQVISTSHKGRAGNSFKFHVCSGVFLVCAGDVVASFAIGSKVCVCVYYVFYIFIRFVFVMCAACEVDRLLCVLILLYTHI
jgi:hypothetical protein